MPFVSVDSRTVMAILGKLSTQFLYIEIIILFAEIFADPTVSMEQGQLTWSMTSLVV
jgi:hypothetical protein